MISEFAYLLTLINVPRATTFNDSPHVSRQSGSLVVDTMAHVNRWACLSWQLEWLRVIYGVNVGQVHMLVRSAEDGVHYAKNSDCIR